MCFRALLLTGICLQASFEMASSFKIGKHEPSSPGDSKRCSGMHSTQAWASSRTLASRALLGNAARKCQSTAPPAVVPGAQVVLWDGMLREIV